MEQPELESQLPEWAFVEVMGHSKICGKLTPVKMGVAMMLRVDVLKADAPSPVLVPAPPAHAGVFAYSKMFSPASLFSITPVDYKYCLAWSKERERYDAAPVPYIQPAPEAKQLTSGVPDDFFQFCEQCGFEDVASAGVDTPAKRLKEALEAYGCRNEREDKSDGAGPRLRRILTNQPKGTPCQ